MHNINDSIEWSNSTASLIVDTRQQRDWEQLVDKHVDLVLSLSASFMLTSFLLAFTRLCSCTFIFMPTRMLRLLMGKIKFLGKVCTCSPLRRQYFHFWLSQFRNSIVHCLIVAGRRTDNSLDENTDDSQANCTHFVDGSFVESGECSSLVLIETVQGVRNRFVQVNKALLTAARIRLQLSNGHHLLDAHYRPDRLCPL